MISFLFLSRFYLSTLLKPNEARSIVRDRDNPSLGFWREFVSKPQNERVPTILKEWNHLVFYYYTSSGCTRESVAQMTMCTRDNAQQAVMWWDRDFLMSRSSCWRGSNRGLWWFTRRRWDEHLRQQSSNHAWRRKSCRPWPRALDDNRHHTWLVHVSTAFHFGRPYVIWRLHKRQ